MDQSLPPLCDLPGPASVPVRSSCGSVDGLTSESGENGKSTRCFCGELPVFPGQRSGQGSEEGWGGNAKRGPLSFLEANCPVEAKAYRELQRKQEECEGRGFTSGEPKWKQCMGGQMLEGEASEEAPAKSRKAKADAEPSESDSSKSNSDTVLEGAKSLKGLFGF